MDPSRGSLSPVAALLVALGMATAVSAQQPGSVVTEPARVGAGLEAPAGFDLGQALSVLSDPLAGAISAGQLDALQGAARRPTRGASPNSAAKIFQRLAPSVVLVAVKGGSGSGSLVDERGWVLTNWHVVRGASEAGVIFKPAEDGARFSTADLVRARVMRVDEVADLALLKVDSVPPGIERMPMGNAQDVQVGADVHAIGHPAGQHWTYTRGVISQRRLGFEWNDNTGKQHVANVVQTQTPINHGNSGGPLISDDGRMIGVNTFKSTGNENLNFAISVDEVRRFLASNSDRFAANVQAPSAPASATGCQATRETARGRSKDGQFDYIGYDLKCRGTTNMEVRLPVDPAKPMVAVFDRNEDGKIDLIVHSPTRDGKWLYSFHDNDFDGQWDLVGHHPDGKIVASRFESHAVWVAGRATR